jgi:rare lipoprotein A
MPRFALWLALPLLAGCAAPLPAPAPRYVVGAPYEMGGVWSYPREDFQLVQTGLAAIAADQRAGRRTANGEIYDPAALTAAHRTLQLPAIVEVTNLQTGLQLQLRVNDRGPANPGRVLELSRRAAELLGVPPGGTAQLRLAVQGGPSRMLAAGLPQPDAPAIVIAAVPVAAVQREDLPPPPGATQAARVREARALPGPRGTAAIEASPSQVPARLPETVSRVPAAPGRLLIEASSFTRRDAADRQAARLRGLGARVETLGGGGRGGGTPSFRVRIGPFASVAEADRALEGTLRAGVSEARIIVD